jgi:hypothetical protein
MSQDPDREAGTEEAPNAAATLFDLRTVIAVLFGGYGIVLTLMGVFGSDPAQLAKAGGININLWSGVVMLIVAALFLLWVRLRPPATGRPETE